MTFSLIFLAVFAAILAVSTRRPLTGLLAVVILSTFYSILREASAGSGLFFIWPYLAYGVLLVIVGTREGVEVLRQHGVGHAGLVLTLVPVGVLVALLALMEFTTRGVTIILADTSLKGLGTVLSGGAFAALVTACGFFGLLCVAMIFRAIRRREGRVAVMDWVMLAFLLWGGIQIINTYMRNGILFTGLNGFRYYFVGAMVYFPARCLIRTAEHRSKFTAALVIACVLGSLELMFENYLLNVRGVQPSQMPWVGHLFAQFQYAPDPDRGFFDGNFFPLGFMYMSHVSGLFLLLGFALVVPRLLAARSWFEAVLGLLLAALFVANSVWTSRTVLLLLLATYLGAAAMARASFARRMGGAIALVAFIVIASRFLIPGARYDIAGEAKFLSAKAFENLTGAIAIDIAEIVGGKAPVASHTDWHLTGAGTVSVVAEPTRPWGHALEIRAERAEGEYRLVLPASMNLGGKSVRLSTWVRAEPGATVSTQLTDNLGTSSSDVRKGTGQWQLLTATRAIDAKTSSVWVDIDVFARGIALVDEMTIEVAEPDGRITATRLLEAGRSAMRPGVSAPDAPGVSAPDAPGVSAPDAPGVSAPDAPGGKDLMAFVAPVEAPNGQSRLTWTHILLGRGAQFAEWNYVLYGKTEGEDFGVATYSDTKYLEFWQQFGLIGLVLLVWMGAAGILTGVIGAFRARDPLVRAEYAGLTLILLITFASLLHLPSLFKIGYNTAVYVALAALISARAGARTDQPPVS